MIKIKKIFLKIPFYKKGQTINLVKIKFKFLLILAISFIIIREKRIILENSNLQDNKQLLGTNKNYKIKEKVIAITYANKIFKKHTKLNKKSALIVGNVDEHFTFCPNDIDPEFKEKNKEILSKNRGDGYWLWKPYFIYKAFKEKLKEGDYIIYTDAGILYMDSIY